MSKVSPIVNNNGKHVSSGASHMAQNKLGKINANSIIPITAVRTYWKKTVPARRRISWAFNKIKRIGWKLFWMSVLLSVAAYFVPELREKAPVIYQVVDGGMQVMNFIFLWTVRLIAAIGKRELGSTIQEFLKALIELINQFENWASCL